MSGSRSKGPLALALMLPLGALACTNPDAAFTDFVIAVDNETFVLRVSDPEAIQLGFANLRGQNNRFPIGPLRRGDGGFNRPYSWHMDPEQVAFTEAAIEVCDGRPSYVEGHVEDYLAVGYCPWGGRVVAVKP